ncbi:hypothetical protein HDU97_004699 [Phlyctochytrium planicorne]|nr:hypothetical protein HDU97_004699 [Phlyctochytrium planicorne]
MHTFMALGNLNLANATLLGNKRFQDFVNSTRIFNRTTSATGTSGDSNFLSADDPFSQSEDGDGWNRNIPWGPSNFDVEFEPKVFVCGGQLVPGSVSFSTSCFVDASTCRSGTVQRVQQIARVGPLMLSTMGAIAKAPTVESLEFLVPLSPTPALPSLRSVLEFELNAVAFWHGREDWKPSFAFRAIDRLETYPNLNPLHSYELDQMIKANVSYEKLMSSIEYFRGLYSEDDWWNTSTITSIDVQYGIRSVSTFGFESLPILKLGNFYEPVPETSPFILKYQDEWNWMVHSASCHHETLICDAVVDSGEVTNVWGCIPIPVFCQNNFCHDVGGIGSIWTAEPSLVYALKSVQEKLMKTSQRPNRPDYRDWNATWTNETESDATLYARISFEKAFGLLHFAWSMSWLPLNFNATANDTLVMLNVTREIRESRVAVATDLMFLASMLACLGITVLGGIALLLTTRGRTRNAKKVAWDPVDYYHRALIERKITHSIVAMGRRNEAFEMVGLNMTAVAGPDAVSKRPKFISLSSKLQNVQKQSPTGLDLGYRILSVAQQNLTKHVFMTTGVFNLTNATMEWKSEFEAFMERTRAINWVTSNSGFNTPLGRRDNANSLSGELPSENTNLPEFSTEKAPWLPSDFDVESEPKVFVCGGQLITGTSRFTTQCFVDATSCRSGTVIRTLDTIAKGDDWIQAPLFDPIDFSLPLTNTPPLVPSFQTLLETAIGTLFLLDLKSWDDQETFEIPLTFYEIYPSNPFGAFELEMMLRSNASDDSILKRLQDMTVQGPYNSRKRISNINIPYAIRTVSNFGFENLPLAKLGPLGVPVQMVSPFLLNDQNAWNWTVHSASCSHQTLLCDAEVESGVVGKVWGCLNVPVFCEDDGPRGFVCDGGDVGGIGGIWRNEPALAYAVHGVREGLMASVAPHRRFDPEWNATLLNGSDSDAAGFARTVFEKSFGLLHFAWSMSSLLFEADASEGLFVKVNVMREVKESRVAVATDLFFSILMLGCFGVTVLGGGSLLLMARGSSRDGKRVGWDPVDFYHKALVERENTVRLWDDGKLSLKSCDVVGRDLSVD